MEVVEVHGGGGVGACWRWMVEVVEVMEVGGGGGLRLWRWVEEVLEVVKVDGGGGGGFLW